ncbi:MAG: hypothetical protein U0234_26680 [Sandaracinus sp.]
MPRFALVLLALALSTACSPAVDPPMTRSCRGEYVEACRPYTYAIVTRASLTPERIALNDPTMMAHVHVELTACDMAPSAPRVNVAAIIGGSGDASIPEPGDGGGSSGARVVELVTVGPPPAGSSVIDVDVANPFFANVPPDSHVTLRFSPVIGDCEGDPVTSDYQTGPIVATP